VTCSLSVAKVFLIDAARWIVEDADYSFREASIELWKGQSAAGEKGEDGAGKGGGAHFLGLEFVLLCQAMMRRFSQLVDIVFSSSVEGR
jgi:hypothetical protein